MTEKRKFEIIKNEEEHKNNSCRIYAQQYCYYRKMGCSKEQSREWAYLNLVNRGIIKLEGERK